MPVTVKELTDKTTATGPVPDTGCGHHSPGVSWQAALRQEKDRSRRHRRWTHSYAAGLMCRVARAGDGRCLAFGLGARDRDYSRMCSDAAVAGPVGVWSCQPNLVEAAGGIVAGSASSIW